MNIYLLYSFFIILRTIYTKEEYSKKYEITENTVYEFNIEPNEIYLFEINKEGFYFYFLTNYLLSFYIYDKNGDIQTIEHQNKYFKKGDKIYAKFSSDDERKAQIRVDYLEIYDKINSFITLKSGFSFIIRSSVDSMAYFDCFDKESIIYISKTYQDFEFKNQGKITDKFYEIKANEEYYIKIKLYFFPSVIRIYVNPLNLNKSEINMIDGEINYLYLKIIINIYLILRKINLKK
jgi:hypothetical protein